MKTRDYHPRHAWDERLSLPHGSVERVVHGSQSWRQAQTGQMSLSDYWADVARQLQLTKAQVEQLAEDFYSGDQLDDNLLYYIRQLRAEGYSVALLSNDSPALSTRLHDLGIKAYFDPIVISGNIGVMKPDPRAYQAALDALQRPAHETIFIDDLPANIEGAAALGIHAVHYVDGMDLESTLQPLLNILS